MKKYFILALLALSLSGCTKDDVPTQTFESVEFVISTETTEPSTEIINETAHDLVLDSLDDLPITGIEVIAVDEDGNIQSQNNFTTDIGQIYINSDDEQVLKNSIHENQSNSEIKSFSELAEEYVNTPVDERNTGEINNSSSQIFDIESESNIITDEMHDELQAEINDHNKAQAEASINKYKEQLEAYYKD